MTQAKLPFVELKEPDWANVAELSAPATNGKMSNAAAAVILDRLLRMPDWSRAYRQQRERMFELAARARIDILGKPEPEVISLHVSLVAPQRFAVDELPKILDCLPEIHQRVGS
jgi:hypothetical protein